MTAPRNHYGKSTAAWKKMCLDKTRFSDEMTARIGAQRMLTENVITEWRTYVPTELYVYKCENCKGFHISKKLTNLKKTLRYCQSI